MATDLPIRFERPVALLCSLAIGVTLLLPLADTASAQQIEMTHGPAPEGWTLDDSFGLTFEKREALNAYATVRINSGSVRDNTLDEFKERWTTDDLGEDPGRFFTGPINLQDGSEVYPEITAETIQVDGRRTFVITYASSWPPYDIRITGGTAEVAGQSNIAQEYLISVGQVASVENWTYGVEVRIGASSDQIGDYTGWVQQSRREAEEIIQALRFTGGEGTQADGGASPPGPSDDEPLPWELIVGVGALAGALAAAARRLARRARERKTAPTAAEASPGEQRREDPDEIVGYILQLGQDHLTLTPGEPSPLSITAWRVDAGGEYHSAPEARLRVSVPTSVAGTVRVTPAEGSGQLTCQVALVEAVPVEPTALTVSAEAPQGSTSAEVIVEAEAVYTLEFF